MMADILCQNCGMPNAEEQTQCSFCSEPLQKSTASASIPSGQVPTKKTTAELEPILPQWLRDARQQAREGAQEEQAEEVRMAAENPVPPAQDSPSDFLAGLAATTRQEESEEIPDWMRGVPGLNVPAPRVEKSEEPTVSRRQEIRWEEEPSEEETASQPQADNSESVPSWMQADENAVPQKSDSLDWLTRSEDVPPAPVAQNPLEPTPSAIEDLSWMRALASAPPEAASTAPAVDSAGDLPDWMSSASASEPATPAPTNEAALPDWMRQVEQPAAAQPAATENMPDWLTTMNPLSTSESPAPLPKTAAFISDDSTDSANVDDLFAIEMPDWLSSIAPSDKTIPAPPALTMDELKPGAEEISPASLPSWVQAMRPLENVTPGIFPSSSDQPRESEGPLAGLTGVLPAAPGFVPSGRPKALSIRLQPSEAQQTGATLLEQMLEAETNPRPMRTALLAVSQRSLRWLVAVVLLLSVSLPLLLSLQIVPLPAPSNQNQAVVDVLQALPEGAPALVIVDYEPALAGEMQASALGLMDSFINLRHPRLTLLSTSPTGGALAEYLLGSLQSPLARGEQFTNLGYLPGGTAGILSFAENPPSTMRYNAAWNSAATQGINSFADYAVVILITDQSETARAWVEQTGALRAGRPLLIVSSAQAAPMIRPYLDSGQVNGLLAGLRDGAAFESLSPDDRGPAGFYWTAYNLSLLSALTMIVLGALWNLFNGRRARRSGLDEI